MRTQPGSFTTSKTKHSVICPKCNIEQQSTETFGKFIKELWEQGWRNVENKWHCPQCLKAIKDY